MHACIAALSQNIPAAGVAYSGKFAGVFESLGMGELVVDARTLDAQQALERMMNLYARRMELAAALAERVGAARETIRTMFREALSGREYSSEVDGKPIPGSRSAARGMG
jgi:polysaccharide pyruvyl transferase WcaK-like protein